MTTNTVNGKRYIGQHRSEVFDTTYLGSGVLLLRAVNKYGKEKFKIEILVECDSCEELNQQEYKFVEDYNACKDSQFYNVAVGGYMGSNYEGMSPERKQEVIDKWKHSYNSRTEEEKQQTIEKWRVSCSQQSLEKKSEISRKLSTSGKLAQRSLSEEQMKAKLEKAAKTRASRPIEESQRVSNNYTQANIRRWQNMTEQQLAARTETYKATRGKQTQEQRDSFSKKCKEEYANRVWIHKGTKIKHVLNSDVESYLMDGFTFGRGTLAERRSYE